jgi:CHAT domain-containing protein/tetratricopeptide (TPR) repeat protein
MRGCVISHEVGARLWLALALAAISSCAQRQAEPIDGLVVFDEDVQLVRGAHGDSVQREISVSADATLAVFVFEDDCDVTVRLEAVRADRTSAAVEVENSMFGQSLEVAVLDVPRDSRVVLRLDAGQDWDSPCHARTRVVSYASARSNAHIAARLAALRAWTAATRAGGTPQDLQRTGHRDMGLALAHFSSADGDAALAAWARLVRADLHNSRGVELQQGAADAARAATEFSALGEPRNEARSRLVRMAILTDIATDKTARDPTADEAAREVEAVLPTLVKHPALSGAERARATNFLGLHAYNLGRFNAAREHYRAALTAFEGVHNRRGRLMVRSNLGVLAAELGDFFEATRYFDLVVADLHQVASVPDRVMYLTNAARADTDAGYVDRAIERLQLARQLNAGRGLPQHEARLLHALGRAYWARGDMTQAAVYFKEALRLRRLGGEPPGLMATLRYAGIIERDAGRIDAAISMHREALELSMSDDVRLRGLLDLASDYAAIPDYRRAIATCREALALPLANPEFYKRYEAQLALGEFLLDQPEAGAAAREQAAKLSTEPLAAALRRSDVNMEIAARHLLARSLAARGQWHEARAEYERTIGLIFQYSSTSTNPELQAYTLAREQATFRGYLDLLMRGAAAKPGALRTASPAEVEALRAIEWARARGSSHARSTTLESAAAAQVDGLLAQMAGKRVRMAALLERSEDSAREIELLQLDIAKLRTDIDRIRARPRLAAASTSAAGAPALTALASDVVQWSYAFGNQHVYLWVRDARGIRAAVLPLTPGELQRRLVGFNTNLRQPAVDVRRALVQLATIIVPEGALDAEARVLEIVADGRISNLPFAALPDIGDRAIVLIGSAFGAGGPAKPRARALRFLGVASAARAARSDTARVFPALGSTTREARSVAAMFERSRSDPGVKLLLGDDGSSVTLAKFWRAGVDVLHVATHGLADLRQPMTSLLMLPANDAGGNATYLTAGQVQEWRGDADLVYLSACETAVGPTRFADGMPGLQRAFLRAGARGVIATLWPVEDVYASQFATDFYRRYINGMPASRALAETQRAWMQPVAGLRATEQAHRSRTAWAHAYYVH